jgi:hypothetical protein
LFRRFRDPRDVPPIGPSVRLISSSAVSSTGCWRP